jgi:hypothetical protein
MFKMLRNHHIHELFQLGMVVHTCGPSIWEAEAGRLRIWGQLGLHSETLSQKNELATFLDFVMNATNLYV